MQKENETLTMHTGKLASETKHYNDIQLWKISNCLQTRTRRDTSRIIPTCICYASVHGQVVVFLLCIRKYIHTYLCEEPR